MHGHYIANFELNTHVVKCSDTVIFSNKAQNIRSYDKCQKYNVITLTLRKNMIITLQTCYSSVLEVGSTPQLFLGFDDFLFTTVKLGMKAWNLSGVLVCSLISFHREKHDLL